MIKEDSLLQKYIRSIFLFLSTVYWKEEYLDDLIRAHWDLDVALAHVLHLALNLESFVFVLSDGSSASYELTLEALCELSALKTLVISNLNVSMGDRVAPKYKLKSRVLQNFVANRWVGTDMSAYLGSQKLLKEVALVVEPCLSLGVATSWVALEKLTMDLQTEEMSEGDFGLWPLIVSNGLVTMYRLLEFLC
jgi:hypothetical protein